MADNAWQAEPENASALWATAIRRTPYVLDVAEDSQTIDLQTSLVIYRSGSFYAYDPTDTTTAHDGVAVLVDQNGRRYKLTDDIKRPLSVLDRSGTPPGSPAIGDAYLLTAGATGAWAGHDDDTGIYTASGWRFIAPQPGMVVYVEDEDAFYHHKAAGSWAAGLGTLSLSSGAITPVEDAFWGGLAVEDVLDTPPGAPTNGQAWLVGTSPTGAWVGQNDKVAYRRSGAWVYLDPYEGAQVWDKSQDLILTYSGTWAIPAEIQPVETEIINLSGLSSYDILDLGDFVKIDLIGVDFGAVTVRGRTSTDNGGAFNIGATDYRNVSGAADADHIALTNSGLNSINGFNKSSVKTINIPSSGNIYQRSTAEANNAFRVYLVSGTWGANARLLINKYRG